MNPLQPYPDPLDAGRLIVSVPIYSSPGDSVVMFAEDYERWSREHGIRNPHLRQIGAHRYVIFRPHGRKDTCIILARFLMDSPRGRQVFLVDGDPLNLRRTNLGCRKGGNGGATWTQREPKTPAPVRSLSELAAMWSQQPKPRPVILPPMPRKAVVAEKVRTRGTV